MKRSQLILIAIPLLLLLRGEAYACKCGPPSVKWSFEKVPVIFSGEVVKLDLYRATLKVEKAWKGALTEEIVLLTGKRRDSSGHIVTNSCDFRYALGEKYLVYASRAGKELKASVCSRSRRLESAVDDIKVLERLKQGRDERNQGALKRHVP
jgi:hypothetical protein